MPYTDANEVRERLDRIEIRLAALERVPPALFPPSSPSPAPRGKLEWLETNPVVGGVLLAGLVLLLIDLFARS